ncbi:hypothetical protein CPB83DRAFT_860719 [Crepidotus variabilis]|uniref:DUF6534 domain-containing protein n=1 Tax=Crepidotus variabilis TaxID=179855 RepID=A0A9P6E9E9_9AGAR|nr:hypothetical protein CPB83DRAFT_860719 [Crepidotus variabilis]
MMTVYETTLGPAFFGILVATGLYGAMGLQTLYYYQHNENDLLIFKLLVGCLGVLETIRLSFLLHTLYGLFVLNFGNLGYLNYPPWSFVAAIILSNLVELIVRGVYAARIYVLYGRYGKLKRIALPAVILCLSLMVFISGAIYGAKRSKLHMIEEQGSIAKYLYISFSGAVVADFMSAISLCTVLFHSRTGIKRTDSILRILMAFSINTGLLTSFASTACFVTYTVWPVTFIYMGVLFSKSQLYVNSYFATLNARESFRQTYKTNSSHGPISVVLTSVNALHTMSMGSTAVTESALKGGTERAESIISSEGIEHGRPMAV